MRKYKYAGYYTAYCGKMSPKMKLRAVGLSYIAAMPFVMGFVAITLRSPEFIWPLPIAGIIMAWLLLEVEKGHPI